MQQVLKIEQLMILQNAFDKVFKTNDPFGEMFQDYVEDRMIICPTNGYNLDEEQFKALIETLVSMGDKRFNISEVELEGCFSSNKCNHLEFYATTKYEEYISIPLILENAIYSIEGKWGILISHEDHAVIGGTKEFISKFREMYSSWKNGFNNFLEKWDYNQKHYDSNLEWLPKFINHINDIDN